MKSYTLLLLTAISLLFVSCTTATMGTDNKIKNTDWELEYINGPRIAFQGLFPEEKPMLSFQAVEGKVNGSTGCNGYNTEYTRVGNLISFKVPAAMTMRYCEGGGEQFFMNAMKDINKYQISAEGKLELMKNDIVMLRFKKIMK